MSRPPPAGDDGAAHAAPRLRLLGRPRLEWSDGRHHLLAARDAALLALLVLEGTVPRARAAAHIWPTADGVHARNNLRQRLQRLHRTAAHPLVSSGDTLRLAAGVEHDLQPGAEGELLGVLDLRQCAELAGWIAQARERWRETGVGPPLRDR